MRYLSSHPLESYAARLETADVLDVGCGAFDTVRQALDRRGKFHFIGLEFSDTSSVYGPMAELEADIEASGRFRRLGCDVDREPFPLNDASIDVVFMSHLLEHLHNVDHCMREVRRVIRPGGLLYIETPGRASLLLPKRSWLQRTSSGPDLPLTLSFWDDPTHVQLWPKETLALLVSNFGFRIEKCASRRAFGIAGIVPSMLALAAGVILPAGTALRNRLVGAGWWNLVGWADYIIATAS